MSKFDLEIIGRKRGHHPRDESLDVIANCDFTSSAERWCEENIPSGLWMNKRSWFSFRREFDAYAFRELWGDA